MSIRCRSDVDLMSIWCRSDVDPVSIRRRSDVDPTSIRCRSDVDPMLIRCRSESISGEISGIPAIKNTLTPDSFIFILKHHSHIRHDSLSVETLISVVFVPRFALISLFSCSFWMNFCYFSVFFCFSESCLKRVLDDHSRRPIVILLDWSVKYAVQDVPYAKHQDETENRCCHFWKWRHHAFLSPGGQSGGQIGVKIANSL